MTDHLKGIQTVPFTYWVFVHTMSRQKPEDRPAMRRAGQTFRLLQSWIKMTRWMYWSLPREQAYVTLPFLSVFILILRPHRKFYDAIGWLALTGVVYLSASKLVKAQP